MAYPGKTVVVLLLPEMIDMVSKKLLECKERNT
jgi:hypothetical protein